MEEETLASVFIYFFCLFTLNPENSKSFEDDRNETAASHIISESGVSHISRTFKFLEIAFHHLPNDSASSINCDIPYNGVFVSFTDDGWNFSDEIFGVAEAEATTVGSVGVGDVIAAEVTTVLFSKKKFNFDSISAVMLQGTDIAALEGSWQSEGSDVVEEQYGDEW